MNIYVCIHVIPTPSTQRGDSRGRLLCASPGRDIRGIRFLLRIPRFLPPVSLRGEQRTPNP